MTIENQTPPMKTGDYVWITCQGRTVKGIITLASPNGKSLALAFDAMLSGHVGMMPVFLDDDGVYRSIFDGVEVQLEKADQLKE